MKIRGEIGFHDIINISDGDWIIISGKGCFVT